MTGTLLTRYNGIATRSRDYQSDITPPVLTKTNEIRGTTGGVFTYTFDVNENSYAIAGTLSAVAASGQGMPVTFSGGGLCNQITGTSVMINTGSATVTLTLPSSGLFSGCMLAIRDHAGNWSNTLQLENFRTDEYAICLNPALTVPQAECEALIDLRVATNGSGWTNTGGWLQTTDVESRRGITLANGQIRNICLGDDNEEGYGNTQTCMYLGDGNNLSGTLPLSITQLTGLTVLAFGNNNLQGTLLDEIGSMTGLIWIVFTDNNLTGTVPSSWGNLTGLTRLYLEENNLNGELPSSFQNLTALQYFQINNNNFTGEIQNRIGAWSDIRYLYLYSNNFR